MPENEKDERITVEIKISIPPLSKGIGSALDHFLKASEELMKAGRAVAVKPEIRTRVKKIDVK